MHNLGIPLPVRIGDTGAIIGNATTAAGESVAAYRNQHGWIRLPLRGFDGSHGEDVNDAGTAVGTLFDDPHGSAPFVYANGVLAILPSVPTASEHRPTRSTTPARSPVRRSTRSGSCSGTGFAGTRSRHRRWSSPRSTT